MGRNVENLTAEKFESLYTSRRSIFNVVRGYMPTCISTVLLKKEKREKKKEKERKKKRKYREHFADGKNDVLFLFYFDTLIYK